MIQFILMLFGLAFPSNDSKIAVPPIIKQSSTTTQSQSAEDTSGDNGQLPPKK